MSSTIVRSATATVLLGIAAFVAFDVLLPEEHRMNFETVKPNVGPLESVNGIPFPRTRGYAVITEPLAHIRLPLGRTLLGKRLVIRPRFHLDEGDVLEVGVKKSAFWLDYDRQPLAHRTLDALAEPLTGKWKTARSGVLVVFLHPQFENPWKTVEEFERNPPTDGRIGVYGNAVLPSFGFPGPTTDPFRLSDAPESFRAIYAWYPEPNRADPEWTENEQRFDLTQAFQNDDGSVDVMFFLQRRGEGPIRVLVDDIYFRIEPGWPRGKDILVRARANLAALVKRPPQQP